MRVYISSTSMDLKDHRRALIDALRQGGFTVVCMEDYPAQDVIPVDKCLRDVASCELYVGILAWRYGFIPPGRERSITELEYREAEEHHIPTLVFLLDAAADWPDAHRDHGADGERIRALREEVCLKKLVKFFEHPQDLATNVLASLFPYILGKHYSEVSLPTPDQQLSVDEAVQRHARSTRPQDDGAQNAACEPIPIALPTLRGLFVDREAEREYLRNWLIRHDRKILLIVAPGGFGKTELTTKVLKEIAPGTTIIKDAVQGILYLRCAGGQLSLGRVFDDAGRMRGKQEEFRRVYADGNVPVGRKLEYFFRELSSLGNVWIVMDNFEDLLAEDDKIADPELREFLEVAVALEHTVRMIVTSRAIPRFKGTREVAKLDLSAGLPEDEAVKYLRQEGADYGLAEAEESLLCAFVRRVRGIPKALESVLGYLDEHYPEISLAQLMADATFFADFDRHDLESGLKKLVAEQYARQSLDAKLVLCALSIFPHPAPPAALRFLLPAIPPTDFAKLVNRLEQSRLVIREGETYDLHPIVRDYVYQSIPEGQASPESAGGGNGSPAALTRTALHARAVDFYRRLVAEHPERTTLSDFEPHLQEVYHLIRAQQYDAALPVLDGISQRYLRAWGHHQRVIELREQLVGRLTGPSGAQRNLNNLALCYDVTGRVRLAIARLEEALRIARQIVDRRNEAAYLNNLGHLYCGVGDLRKAVDCCAQALELDRECNNRWGQGIDMGTLGWARWQLGELRSAIDLYTQALKIVQEAGDRRFEGTFLGNLGRIYMDLGELSRAVEHLRDAAAISRSAEDWAYLCLELADMGHAWVVLGDCQQGAKLADEAFELAVRIPYPRGEVRALLCHGRERSLAGEARKAGEAYLRACGVAQQTGDRIHHSMALYGLGRSYHQEDKLADAQQCYQDALALNMPRTNYRCAVLLGVVRLKQGMVDSSQSHLAHGLDLCRDMLTKTPGMCDAWYHLALAQLAAGQADQAAGSYQSAISACSAEGAARGALQDLRLLEHTGIGCPGLKEAAALLEAVIPPRHPPKEHL